MRAFAAVLALGFIVCASPALAHITLEVGAAPVGAEYKAVLRVPHGCDGAPTIKLSVRVPAGVISVKPQPKPGWQIETIKGTYAVPVALNGTSVTEGVTTIVWSGGSLPDDYYDEFVFAAFIADTLAPGSSLYFPVVQECPGAVVRWIEIPEPGKTDDDYETPAPGLKLLPNAGRDD